jgi:hypothetical protein
MSIEPMRILVVYADWGGPGRLSHSVWHHLHALDQSETKHEVTYLDAWDIAPRLPVTGDEPPEPVRSNRDGYDAVILHNTFLCARWATCFYEWKHKFDWIGGLDCPKIAIPQDEGDHAGILDEWLCDLRVTAIFSVHQPTGQGPLYPYMRDRAAFYPCLPGYIDADAAEQYVHRSAPDSSRPLDIVYRAMHLPFWFGSAGQQKHRIAEVVGGRATARGLRCDISTRPEDTILGDRWLTFLASSRATVGCEGGSNVIDWRGEVRAAIESKLKKDPACTYERVAAQMPEGWDGYRFLTVTARHFEAVITRTCQILLEGHYKGILHPYRHYIPLKHDFSNLDEVLDLLGNKAMVEEMTERAYEEVYVRGQHTYRHFARAIEKAVGDQRPRFRRGDGAESDQGMIRSREAMELQRQVISERFKTGLLEARQKDALAEAARLQAEVNGLLRERRMAKALFVYGAAALGILAVLAAAAALLLGGHVGP